MTTAMKKQTLWEDAQVGQELPPFVNKTGLMELNRFAGANEELVPIHMDVEAAKKAGLPDVIVMGNLKVAYLSNVLTDWAGDKGMVKKLSCQYRGMDVVNATLTAKAKVTNKYVKDGEHLIDLEVWVENDKGQKTTPGAATVRLPSRG